MIQRDHELRCRTLAACITLALATMLSRDAWAQTMRFVNVGAGVSVPSGTSAAAMRTGWLGEVMGGVTLPGNTVTLRLGASYGENRIDATPGSMMTGAVPGSTSRMLGVMTGVMVMPDIDRDFVPYLLAGAGLMRSTSRGSASSFAWAGGVGANVETGLAAFYVESRFMRARRSGRNDDMIPITAGVRLGG